MSRVLAVIHAPHWGGLHTVVERVGPACAERGWPWTVVVPAVEDNGRARLEAAGLRVVEIPLRRIRRTRDLRTQATFAVTVPVDVARLARLVRRERAGVVQVAGLLHFHGAVAAGLTRTPLVWQLHSDQPPRALKRLMTPWVVRSADAVMTSGGGLVERHPGLEAAASRVVPFTSPVDVHEFRPDADRRAEARRLLGAAGGDVVVGTVGGRGPNKNHRMLVEAAIRTAVDHPHVRYAICGGWLPQHREDYERDVVGLAARHGLIESGIVSFHEPGTQVSRYMAGFDVFALTSLGEGASIVTAEALATGVPVVVNDVGSLRESVEDGRTGYLNTSGEVAELVDRIRVLADDPERRRAMGVAARTFAERRFSVAACAEAHVRAYELARARAGPARRR